MVTCGLWDLGLRDGNTMFSLHFWNFADFTLTMEKENNSGGVEEYL